MGDKGAVIANVVTAVLPSVVGLIRDLVKQQNPEIPPPTSAEIMLIFSTACTKSLAKDDEWLATHQDG